MGRACRPCPNGSDIDLFGNGQGIVYLDAEIPHCAFNLGVTKEKLHGSKVAGAALDQRCLGSAKRMGAVHVGVKVNAGEPLG